MDICSNKRAAGNSPELSDDLLIEILSRLHPKTLTTLKSTSKTWHRLASSIILHSQTKTPVSGFFIRLIYHRTRSESIQYYLPDQTSDHPLTFLPSHPHTTILDSHHGFLLCSSSNPNTQNNGYYLCNPITRQWVSLPPPPLRISLISRPFRVQVNVALVFDDPTHVSSEHYRVFRFSSGIDIDMGSCGEGHESENPPSNRSRDLCVDIYTSGTRQWAKSKASFKRGPFFYLFDRPSVFLDGAIYLLGAPLLVLRFHVEEEWYEFIPLPSPDLAVPRFFPMKRNNTVSCLGVCQGSVCYAYHNCTHLQVWMFDDCEPSKWVLKHAVELGVFGIMNPPLVARDHLDIAELPLNTLPFNTSLDTEVLLDILAFHPSLDAVFVRRLHCFYWYHPQSRKFERIMSCHPSTTANMWTHGYRVHPFSEWYTYQRL